MELLFKMSVGMVCTLVAIAAIALISFWIYKKRETTDNHPIVIGMSLIALVVSITTVIYLFFGAWSRTECCFNYSNTSVTILSMLVSILLGWNIWRVIDNKGFEKRVQGELNYVHNKIDSSLGLMYGYFSQMLATNISDLEKQKLKVFMLQYMINSLKILSKMPNTSIEIDSIANTIANVMEATRLIVIESKDAQIILERLGEIENREEINAIDVIRNELLSFIKNNGGEVI